MTTAYIAWLRDDGSAVDPALLPPAEQVELAGFRSQERQRSFLLSRLLLRKLLRPLLPGSALEFLRAEDGRLLLPDAQGWYFSLSHSGGGIAAIACTQPCGIDIETPRQVAFEKIAARYFSRAEQDALEATAPGQRMELFFRLWTLKEASVKALGEGLAGNMARLAFAVDTQPPRLLNPATALKIWQQHQLPHWLAAAIQTDSETIWNVQQYTPDSLLDGRA